MSERELNDIIRDIRTMESSSRALKTRYKLLTGNDWDASELNRVLDEVVERLQLCKYTHEEQDHKDDVVSFYDLEFVIKELKESQ